jgi:hypothetical protein
VGHLGPLGHSGGIMSIFDSSASKSILRRSRLLYVRRLSALCGQAAAAAAAAGVHRSRVYIYIYIYIDAD